MLSKIELKYYASLLRKKIRSEEGKFIAEGRRMLEEGLHSSYKCEIVFASTHFRENNPDFMEEFSDLNLRIENVTNSDFLKLSDTENPQGIAAAFQMPDVKDNIGRSDLIVALENVSDPGNAGTIIRTSDWFGIKEVVLSQNSVELYNPKVLRSSMGSVFHLHAFESQDFLATLNELKSKGYKILCADMEGEDVFGFSSKGKSVIVLSSEAQGPSEELLAMSDSVLAIPRLGQAESLNVASASAVILGEVTRRRDF
ncbi:MAG: RNA methyltransferase [Ignavibacteria bacterium]|jgi:TrmH family RNA methyltransferase|nr:RNA methyltransferase [Ignavibacteria bacterium]MCU7502532.1 RNA methyltransferase [Ignavibacteria bacterium]MCU7515265.1 RNA methyltransferase [Ignavibacteria bacterium]